MCLYVIVSDDFDDAINVVRELEQQGHEDMTAVFAAIEAKTIVSTRPKRNRQPTVRALEAAALTSEGSTTEDVRDFDEVYVYCVF
jgi:hypothetical protein